MTVLDWFEIRKLDPQTYIISENKHWEEFNSYFLLGDEYNLLIDCGIGIYNIKNILTKIDNKKIKLLITHMHWDHIGNLDKFKEVYLSEKANYYLKNGVEEPIESIRKKVIKDVDKKLLPTNFNIDEFKLETSNRGREILEGKTFEMGNREIEVVSTPGHTDDHLCFYDLSHDYLFAGDLLYKGPLYLNSDNINLDKFFYSLNKILKKYNNMKCILSSHYDPIINLKYLKDIYKFILKLKDEGKYEKGSGFHQLGEYKIYL